jgi:hypothetical protein
MKNLSHRSVLIAILPLGVLLAACDPRPIAEHRVSAPSLNSPGDAVGGTPFGATP